MARYNGFSTFNKSKHFRLTDFELVKQDLLNHFNIRKGEKPMQPNFGTGIWDILFDPLNTETRRIITEDVRTVIGYDPRVAAKNVVVSEYNHGIQIQIELVYVSTNQVDVLAINFDRDSKTASTGGATATTL